MSNAYPKQFGSKAATPIPAYDALMVPGVRVRLTGKFLANTGQRTGGEGRKVWEILAVDGDYWTTAEHAANPNLKDRRIAKANLAVVGKPTHRDDT